VAIKICLWFILTLRKSGEPAVERPGGAAWKGPALEALVMSTGRERDADALWDRGHGWGLGRGLRRGGRIGA
jgi:hypothetical protein